MIAWTVTMIIEMAKMFWMKMIWKMAKVPVVPLAIQKMRP